jgi:hypothetical protein
MLRHRIAGVSELCPPCLFSQSLDNHFLAFITVLQITHTHTCLYLFLIAAIMYSITNLVASNNMNLLILHFWGDQNYKTYANFSFLPCLLKLLECVVTPFPFPFTPMEVVHSILSDYLRN